MEGLLSRPEEGGGVSEDKDKAKDKEINEGSRRTFKYSFCYGNWNATQAWRFGEGDRRGEI